MNLRHVVHDIRERVIRQASQPDTTAPDRTLLPVNEEVAKLRLTYEQLFALRNSVGRTPASPNTFRAKAGMILVRMVQRMLFWYTPQIQRFHQATVAVAEHTCSALEKQVAALQRYHAEFENIRSEMRLRGAQTAVKDATGEAALESDAGFDHFVFALRNSMLGPEVNRQSELRDYIAVIESLAPPIADGVWLDLSCGRGDWLKTLRSAEREGLGLDDNIAARAHCEGLGFRVLAREPLAYLRNCAESSFAVITALQVLNRYPAATVFSLVRECVRTLKPGGVLILELPNPASLLAGANESWIDPAHRRPIPYSTARFLVEYFGLQVVAERTLNRFGEEQLLPFAELDFVQQLNSVLYGPRAYALLARRSERSERVSRLNGFGGSV